MELQFSSSIIITAILFLFLPFLYRLLSTSNRAKLFNRNTSRLPPGPWKLPVIGNLHHLLGSLQKPHRGVSELAKKYGGLMHLQLGNMSLVVVSSREMAKQVLKTHDLAFADRPQPYIVKVLLPHAGRNLGFTRYGEYWRQMRKLCMLELLSSQRVRSFSSLREQEASNLIESIHSCANSPINLTEKMFSYTGTVVCRTAFGSNGKDQLLFSLLSNELITVAGGFGLSEMFPSLNFLQVISGQKAKFMKIHEEADKILENIINEHRQKTTSSDDQREDLVDVLLRLQKSGNLEVPVTDADVKAVVWEMFTGGTDTSTVTTIWAMAEMMRNPRVMKKAQAEIREKLKGKKRITETDIQELSYLKLLIKETLRLHIPGPFLLPRECREQCEINGYEIPLKTKVLVDAWALSRDPEYWDDPESFIPERFSESSIDFKGTDFKYIPFGAGRRICPGITFGSANIEILLAQLLYHFDWKLPDGIEPEKLDMTEVFGAVIRKSKDLILVATPYIHSEI